ncbi:outer membrane protein TolC [Wenyingzhuangia heitensis]|uniref:Outer membrane protein TolC n=1 Tax=Wenyingzhuangia heitensis TaxID=1487859 RepID=A0ABX0UC34_9FLAO|nr:TolC family protein [Wenyingzhuangia heitensis]NIJ46395.1 outer membrane protein TolC [Wenyingzhuangia heitensis]
MNTYKYILSFVFLMGFSVQHIHAQKQVLTLEKAKTLAKTNNKKTLRALQNIEAAKAAKASVSATDKPYVEASAMGIHVGDPLNVLLPDFQASASLGVTQVIYAGGKIRNSKKMSATAINLYSAQKELTEAEVLLDVETTYWQIINVNAKVDLAHKYKDLLTELLKDLTNSYDAGLIYKNDVLQVQVQLNQALLDLIKAEDGLSILKLRMAQLIGLNNSDFEINTEMSNKTLVSHKVNSEEALAQRPEIKMLTESVTLENLQTKVLKGDRKPTVSLNVSGLYATGKNINFSDGGNNLASYYGVLNVSIPVFDWGKRKQKVKEQEFKSVAKQLELEETEELVVIQIENAYLELQQALKRVEITQKSLEQADENLRLHQDRFEAGTVIGKDVLEAQVLWQQAYSEVIDAKAIQHISLANYKKTIGEIN